MNGILNLLALFAILFYLSPGKCEDDDQVPQLFIGKLDFSRLPLVDVHIGNVTCPKDFFYGITAALQLFTLDDEEQFEFFNNIKCSDINSDSIVISIHVDNMDVAYYPVEKAVYIEYAVAYAWLADTQVTGYADSAIQTYLNFNYPRPESRPKRSHFPPQKPMSFECEREQEIFDVINFPAVFRNGGSNGVIITFPNFTTSDLMAHSLKQPHISLEITLFLHDNCLPIGSTIDYCSIFHAIRLGNNDDEEDTPQLFLTKFTNELMIQVVDFVNPYGLFSYKTGISIKSGLAHKILISVESTVHRIVVLSWDPTQPLNNVEPQIKEQKFDHKVRLNSINWPATYLLFGGSDYFRSFSGFVDSVRVYRTKYLTELNRSNLKLSDLGQKLAVRLKYCDSVKNSMTTTPVQGLAGEKWEKSTKNSSFEEILEKLEKFHSEDLFEQLSIAGCLGSKEAEFLLGVLRRFSIVNDSESYLVNYLKSGLHGDHFADLALGNHLLKENRDLEVAFRYLKAAADLSQQATQQHSSNDRWVDSIHLNNQEELETHQNNDDGPLMAWLLYQAGMGDGLAMHDVARLFYLGAQGVDRDMERAADLFRQAADLEADPEILYDYGVILLHGRGVEANRTLALEYLEKAAAHDYGPAVGAIGWYHMEEDGNLTKAVPYLERAAELGVPEAAHNIGYLLLNNMHPFNPGRHPGLAYGFFVKAAGLGSLEGALMASEFLAKGITAIDLKPSPTEACRYATSVASQSPRLGKPLTAALSSYLAGDIRKAFIHYAIAAETGNDVAMFNLGYLCETQAKTLIKAGLIKDVNSASKCVKNMYETVVYRPFYATTSAPPHALLWLAHEAVERDDLDSAAVYYSDALLAGADEGYYGLAWLAADRGFKIPIDLFNKLITSGDKSLAESLVLMDPVDVALFLMDACMTVEEKETESEFDDEGYASLDGKLKSLPEGYWSCALYKTYIHLNRTYTSFFKADEVAEVLSGGTWVNLLNFLSYHSNNNLLALFVTGFVIGVVGLYPLLAFLASRIASIFRS